MLALVAGIWKWQEYVTRSAAKESTLNQISWKAVPYDDIVSHYRISYVHSHLTSMSDDIWHNVIYIWQSQIMGHRAIVKLIFFRFFSFIRFKRGVQ